MSSKTSKETRVLLDKPANQTGGEIHWDLICPIVARDTDPRVLAAQQEALLERLSGVLTLTDDIKDMFRSVWQRHLDRIPKTATDIRIGLSVTECETPALINPQPFVAHTHTWDEKIADLVNFGL